MAKTKTRATIEYLRHCQRARAAGAPVAFATDPAWLVQMAINRRAGWPDDPGFLRGSAKPVNGKYPKRASDDAWSTLCRVSAAVNTPRLAVRERQFGRLPDAIRARLAHRIELSS